jgi:hypothetical protein
MHNYNLRKLIIEANVIAYFGDLLMAWKATAAAAAAAKN